MYAAFFRFVHIHRTLSVLDIHFDYEFFSFIWSFCCCWIFEFCFVLSFFVVTTFCSLEYLLVVFVFCCYFSASLFLLLLLLFPLFSSFACSATFLVSLHSTPKKKHVCNWCCVCVFEWVGEMDTKIEVKWEEKKRKEKLCTCDVWYCCCPILCVQVRTAHTYFRLAEKCSILLDLSLCLPSLSGFG